MTESDREEQNSSDQTQNSYGAFVDKTSNSIVGTCHLCANPIYASDETRTYTSSHRGGHRHYTVHAVCYQRMMERREAMRKEQEEKDRRSRRRWMIFIGVVVVIVIILIILIAVWLF